MCPEFVDAVRDGYWVLNGGKIWIIMRPSLTLALYLRALTQKQAIVECPFSSSICTQMVS